MDTNKIYNGATYGKGNFSPDRAIDISKFAPIVAQQPSERVSHKYKFIPTTKPLEVLADYGWFPVAANLARVKSQDRDGYQRHVVRLANEKWNKELAVGSTIPQILLTNDHSGSAAFEFLVGLYEKICSNQLCVSRGNAAAFKVRHIGYADNAVEEHLQNIMQMIPATLERVDRYKQIELTQPQQLAYAEAAIELRYDGDKYAVAPPELLRRRHYEQKAPTLWNTYNTVQENVIKGGVRQRRQDGSRIKAKAVTSIKEDIRLNKALWTLTEKMAAIV